jgi:hypothetical protein
LYLVKATKKLKSCACCIGGDDDDDDDEDDSADGGKNEGEGELSKSGMEKDLGAIGTLGSGNKVTRSKYVDGKNKFAFDPTMFNTK